MPELPRSGSGNGAAAGPGRGGGVGRRGEAGAGIANADVFVTKLGCGLCECTSPDRLQSKDAPATDILQIQNGSWRSATWQALEQLPNNDQLDAQLLSSRVPVKRGLFSPN